MCVPGHTVHAVQHECLSSSHPSDHNQVAALAQSILTGTEFIGVSSVDRLTSLVREISTSSNQTNYTSKNIVMHMLHAYVQTVHVCV